MDKIRKIMPEERSERFRAEFIRRWTPDLDSDIVIAEIAVDSGYSFSYVKKMLQPISELKKQKQYVVGEVLEILENNIPMDRLLNDHPVSALYCSLANIDNDQIITDPIMIVKIQKIFADEDL